MAINPKLRYDIELDTKKAQTEAKGFAGSLGGIKGALTGIATLFAASEIIDYGKHLFNVAAAAEETDSALRVVLDGVKGLDLRMKMLADSTLLTETQTKDLVTQLAVSNKSLGLNSEAAFKVSEHMIKIASDIASFRNAVGGTEEVLRDLRSAQLGNYEAAEKWIGSISDAIVKNKALEMGLISSKNDGLDPYTQQMIVLQIAIENMAPAMGDMERTMDSTQNKMRDASVRANELEEDIAEKLQPAFVALLEVINDVVDGVAILFDDEKAIAAFQEDRLRKMEIIWGKQSEAYKEEQINIRNTNYARKKSAEWQENAQKDYMDRFNTRMRAGHEEKQLRAQSEAEYRDQFMVTTKMVSSAAKTVYEERKGQNEDLLKSYGQINEEIQSEADKRRDAAKAAKALADRQREIAKAQAEAVRAAEKYAEVVKKAEASVLNTYKTINDLTKDQMDIRKTMAERVAEELAKADSELTDKQIRNLQKKFGITEAEVQRAKEYLKLPDLEKDLMRAQARIDEINVRKKEALEQQVAELNRVLDARLKELGLTREQLGLEQQINQTINQRGAGGGGGGGTQPGGGYGTQPGTGVPPTSPNQNRSTNNVNINPGTPTQPTQPVAPPTPPTPPREKQPGYSRRVKVRGRTVSFRWEGSKSDRPDDDTIEQIVLQYPNALKLSIDFGDFSHSPIVTVTKSI